MFADPVGPVEVIFYWPKTSVSIESSFNIWKGHSFTAKIKGSNLPLKFITTRMVLKNPL